MCGLCFVSLQERVREDCVGAAFKLAECADSIVEKFKDILEFVGGDLVQPAIGKEESMLYVEEMERVHEDNAE